MFREQEARRAVIREVPIESAVGLLLRFRWRHLHEPLAAVSGCLQTLVNGQ